MSLQSPEMTITVELRPGRGTVEAGRMRRGGRVPAVLYGGDKPPVAISVDERSVKEILKSAAGENTIFLLKLKDSDEERLAMIRELQVDPINGRFTHIDFIRITRGHKLTVKMPVELNGDSIGVRHGGRLDFMTRDVEIELLPREMFDKFVVDVSALEIGDHLRVKDLAGQLPENGRFVTDPERIVVGVEAPRAIAEEETAKAADGALVTAQAAEPEVIGKGKAGDEGGRGE